MIPSTKLNAECLKALAHPLRHDLCVAIHEAPATATQLAERFRQNTGTVSWHLRYLARAGLIEDAPGRGDDRERWWQGSLRGVRPTIQWSDLVDDPSGFQAARSIVRHSVDAQWKAIREWVDGTVKPGDEWLDATTHSNAVLTLTPDQARVLRQDLIAILEVHRQLAGRHQDPGARRVLVAAHVVPTVAGDLESHSD